MVSKLKVLLISPGQHFKRNISPLFEKKEINFEISAIVSRTGNNLIEFSKILTGKKLEDIDEKSYDCIYSSSPNKFHADEVRYAIAKNKHILIEKPICTPENMLSQAEISNKNIIIQEALMYKYHDQFFHLKNLIKNSKYLGELRSINAKFTTPHFSNNNIRYQKELHGGAFNDMAVYPLTFSTDICSDLKLTHISSNNQDFEVDVEGLIILQNSNVRAMLEYGFGYSYQNYAECVFENGIIKIDRPFSKSPSFNNPIQVFQDTKLIASVEYPPCNHFRVMFNKFWDDINNHKIDYRLETRLEQIRHFQSYR